MLLAAVLDFPLQNKKNTHRSMNCDNVYRNDHLYFVDDIIMKVSDQQYDLGVKGQGQILYT